LANYRFLDNMGTFYLEDPENNSYLYFPLAGEQGIKSAITPTLGGDIKTGQNQFILQPVSAEELHNNKSTRNFWCHIEGKGVWSATGVSAEQQSYKFSGKKEKTWLEAGILWHKVTRISDRFGLRSEITSFVPVSDCNVEIMYVEISNISFEPVTLTPTAAVPIYGRSADNIRDHRHVTSLLHRIKTTDYSVQVTPTMTFDERGHQRNTKTYFVSGISGNGDKPAGFYPLAEKFIGEGGSFEWPEAIVKTLPAVKSGELFEGYEAIGAIQFEKVTLQPDESKSYTILIGICNADEDADKIIAGFDNSEKVKSHLEQTISYWNQKNNVSYHTADSNFDNFMRWVSFQPTLRRIYGCSFLPHHDYGRGGRGWRDLWQDCLALLIMNPEGVKEMLINNFGGVRIDGTNATIIGSSPGEFIADRNNITRVWMDHGVWPCMTTKLYINQTGDISVLLKETTYFKDRQVMRGTEADDSWDPAKPPILVDRHGYPYYGTILEHLLLQNITAFYEVGEHNHIRLRNADWNDALDMAPDRGESVAFTAAYAANMDDLADMISQLADRFNKDTIEIAKEMGILFVDDANLYNDAGKKQQLLDEYCRSCYSNISGEKIHISCEKVIKSLKSKAQWIKNHIRESEWIEAADNMGWFNGYYDNHGNKVEGWFNGNVRMMLTSQVFTIMSGTATAKHVEQIISAADKYLYDESIGGYRLNTNFHELKMDLGRMFGFAYGHKENGAVFSHMAVMYANALYKRGYVREGYKAIHTLYRQAMNFEVSRIYPGIPEYFNQEGRGMYHYLTGSASWLMLTVITEMFGIKGDKGNLVIEPKLLKEQFDNNGKADIKLNFGSKSFHIIYVNENHLDYGSYQIGHLYIDGKMQQVNANKAEISLDMIKKLADSKTHEIIVVLENR